ncbi:hybrid sensor histidine kinase/response regulator [Anaeromyxobacter diazotrophicus]|uniref:histidine kinase n=1 Tax=Anaeromyxobacter diazotrophicus TaxID=2590199 RepID=A0A7I9VR39_9BACT|nr:ATP-binding protein [Anaeromyxobacter diazotrophicus]GEJ58892.1 hypothetical protein AMYX_36330 [Anaeromyxobacter diazotrophicus]
MTERVGPATRGEGPAGAPPAAASRPRELGWAVASASGAALLLGLFFFGAWFAGLPARWSATGAITMKTNAALGVALAGFALLLLGPREAAGGRRWAGTAAAAVVLITGAATLAEHLLQCDLGVDQLLASELPGAAATVSPNRMGPPASASLALLGAGLLALGWRRVRFIAPYLGLATCFVNLVPAVGYLFGIGAFYGHAPLTGIAWPTVLALLTLGFGLVLAGRGDGPAALLLREDEGGAFLRRVLPWTLLVPLALGLLAVEGERRGLYGVATGDGALVLALVFFFSVFLWRSAGRVSRAAAAQRSLARFPEENPDPVLRVDGGLTVLYANQAARARLRPLQVEVGRTAPPELAALAGRALAEGRRLETEVRCGDALFSMSVVPVGAEVNLYGQDVTARKAMEEELREADRRKTEFLAVLSHELRNPLAPIRNGVYVLEHAAPGSEQARRAQQVIGRQTGHLARLVDDLLDVTRISRGKIDLRREPLDLREVVRATVEDQRALYARGGIALHLEEGADAVRVEADRTRLAQVLGNLLNNALKFTPAGGAVAVRLEVQDGRAVLRVQDDGQGIDPAHVERMFEPFAQADHGLARTLGGLGLGLALVKSLVELHGGAVRARSEGPGQGAEFVVSLPLAAGGGPASAPAAGAGARRRLVLVIDDNADAGQTLADLLELEGHAVHLACDGRSGVALARELRPDVVLCDIGLPDLDGYEVARTLRREEALRSTRLVALTGYAQPEDRARAAEAGFDAHLAKPPRLEALAKLLGADGD